MADKAVQRRNILKSTLAAAAAVGAAAPLASHAQATVTWRMQALWDGGTTPQKFEERFVARVAETCLRPARSCPPRKRLMPCAAARLS
jgi:hypothetical protein